MTCPSVQRYDECIIMSGSRAPDYNFFFRVHICVSKKKKQICLNFDGLRVGIYDFDTFKRIRDT